MRLGLVTDCHFGPPGFHEGKLRKLSHVAGSLLGEMVIEMNMHHRPDVLVNLGDVIEDHGKAEDREHYRAFLEVLSALDAPLVHVAGNHDTINLSDEELAAEWDWPGELHYSVVVEGVRLVVLRTVEIRGRSVSLPEHQLKWLDAVLEGSVEPCVLLTHHPCGEMNLRGNRWFAEAPHLARVSNRKKLRAVVERHPNVRGVFNGHVHWNHVSVVNGVPYVTVQSLTENLDDDAPGRPAAAYAIVDVLEQGLHVEVYGDEPCRYDFRTS